MSEKPVSDTHITKHTTLEELAKQYYDAGGFVAKKIGIGVNVLEKIFSTDTKVLSFPAALISTGTRGLICDVIKQKKFDIVMTTCGTLDHDFARIFTDYYHGTFDADDAELFKKGINRLGNIFIPNSSYGEIIEEKLNPILKDIYDSGKKDLAPHELVWEIGKRLENEPKKEESLIYWSYKNQIPFIIPGITDGSVGSQIFMFMQQHRDFRVDVFKDEEYLSDIFFDETKTTGALMLGGGISKHHVIWWAQFKGGLQHAVYVTTAPEWDGSLSGARIEEAISWGKVDEQAKFVNIEGDVTILLPLLLGPFL